MWLLWLATNTTGPGRSSRRSRPYTRRRVYRSISGPSTPQTRSSRRRLAALARAQGTSRSAGSAIGLTTLATRDGFPGHPIGIGRDDLARVEVGAGVGALEQRPEHRHTGCRDVLLQPLRVLGADRMVVGQRGARVHERLLDRALHHAVVLQSVAVVRGVESEGEVEAGTGVVGVREVAHQVAGHAQFV